MRTTTILATTLLVTGCNQLFGGEVTGGDVDAAAMSDGAMTDEDGAIAADDARDGDATTTPTDASSGDAPSGCSGWTARVPIAAGPARNSSIAVGPDGVVHVVHDRSDLSLAYLTRAPGGAWTTHPTIADAEHGDVTTDASGTVHLVYEVESGWSTVHYRRRSAGGSWTAPFTTSDDPGGFPQIVITPTGPVVVGRYASSLRLGRPDPTNWGVAVGAEGVAFSATPAITITASGDLHVVGRGWQPGESGLPDKIWHASRSAQTGVWTTVNADPFWMRFGEDAAVAVDAAGTVHVFHTSVGTGAEGELRYARRSLGGMFAAPLAPAPSRVVGDVAVAMDGAGTLHLIYQDTVEADLLYRRRTAAASWSNTETVDSVGGVGADADLAVGPSGTLHAIWYDEPGDRLLYASRCAP